MSHELRKKIIEQQVKGKGYETISKHLDVLLTTAAQIIWKFKVHGTEENLSGSDHKRKTDKLKRGIMCTVTAEPRATSTEVMVEL